MFIGHYGLAFGVKKAAPGISLGLLFIATQFADILWPFLLVFNVEQVNLTPGPASVTPYVFTYYPFSHSLLMGVVWGLLAALLYWLIKRNTRNAVIIGLCVLSHWFLDLIVHLPDLPLAPGMTAKLGLGAWKSVALTQVLEGIFFVGGVFLYVRSTTPKNKIGKWGLPVLIALLLLVHLSSLFGTSSSPSLMGLFVSFNIFQLVVVLLAFWVDKNRISTVH
ncbi:MAG TPA: hypothetical protein VLD19_05310 [Chitinophagaceae bacterium]|nr:hypothetical protein [Chitinophagaceae bacterium]